VLDNPIWHALKTRHLRVALGGDLARRYPPEIAPFVAIARVGEGAGQSLAALVQPGERVGILHLMPEITAEWQEQHTIGICQYAWPEESQARSDGEVVRLGEEHIQAMLDLTKLVYPAYFRTGTARLGDYFGVLDGERLCAMAGIRMSFDGHQELSAICTDPDYRGQGFAAMLTLHIVRHIQDQGDIPFLHTEEDNRPARSLYEKLGFKLRTVLPFRVMQRL